MQAMIFEQPHKPLALRTLSTPTLSAGQVLVDVTHCGVCLTDLHVVDGDLTSPKANLIPGHEIVGKIRAIAPDVTNHQVGDRVGIPWLAETCGQCQFCTTQRENLCDNAIFTGYTRDGGYATQCAASAEFCFKLPEKLNDEHAAPMLCAGLIGWRTLKLAGSTIVCGGIHMSDIPSFAYDDLWQERIIRSVANLTRADATEFFAIAQEIDIKTTVTSYKLTDANQALDDLRSGKVQGAAELNCQSIS